MNIKQILSITAAAMAIAPMSLAAPGPPSQPPLLTYSLVYPNGKPATDATLFQDIYNPGTKAVTSIAYKADKNGQVSLRPNSDAPLKAAGFLYCTSPTGIGIKNLGPAPTQGFTLTLYPLTNVRIHFVDSHAKPMLHLKVFPMGFRDVSGTPSIFIDKVLSTHWMKTTDASGYATFTNLPQGQLMLVSSTDPHYDIPERNNPVLLSQTDTTPDTEMPLDRCTTISGIVRNGITNKPIAGILIQASPSRFLYFDAVSDKDGKFIIGGLSGGDYTVYKGEGDYYTSGIIRDWISDPQEVKVAYQTDATGVVMLLIHGGVIRGKVIDKATGKPLEGIVVTETPATGQVLKVQSDKRMSVTTDLGEYSLRVSPCKATITLSSEDPSAHSLFVAKINIHEGEVKTLNFRIKMPTKHVKPTPPERIGITTVSSIITFWHKNKHLTMQDLKSILPRGTTIDHPDWYEGDQAVGNASSIQGRVNGNAVFLSALQRKKINKGTELTETEQKYKSTDSADMVQIELATKASGKHMVSLLSAAFGAKPSNTEFVLSDSEDAGMVHGVTADWKLAGGLDVTYDDWRYGKSDVIVVSFDGR